VSMLETIRTATLCLKLAASCQHTTNNKKCSVGGRGVDGVDQWRVELNGPTSQKIELNDADWKDNKESRSDDDDEEDDDDDDRDDDQDDSADDAATTLSYKDLFRMATLGGATGRLLHIVIHIICGHEIFNEII